MFGLESKVISRIQDVMSSFTEIEKVTLFGSRAKGNYRPGSDIDLTLIGDDIDLKILNQLLLKLDELMLPYTFDISIFKQITNLEFIEHINRVGIDFYVRKK